MRRYDHFVGGAALAPSGGGVIERTCPANGRLVAAFAAGSAEDVGVAVAAARKAFDTGPWPKMSGMDRARAPPAPSPSSCSQHQERLAQIETEEVGKPIRFARKDIEGAAKVVHYAAGLAANQHGLAYPDLKPGPDRPHPPRTGGCRRRDHSRGTFRPSSSATRCRSRSRPDARWS